MNGNERFEYMAELFYKETGFMAPGKSTHKFGGERVFTEWVEKFFSKLFDDHKSNSN